MLSYTVNQLRTGQFNAYENGVHTFVLRLVTVKVKPSSDYHSQEPSQHHSKWNTQAEYSKSRFYVLVPT